MCDLCKRCLARTRPGKPAHCGGPERNMQGHPAIILGSPTSTRARFRILHFGLPPARPVSRLLRTPQGARWANGGKQQHARAAPARRKPPIGGFGNQPADTWKLSVQVEKNSMRMPASKQASASVREDRPHREPVPARQETPCQPTCSIGRDPSPPVVVRRAGARRPERRTRRSSGAPARGQVGLATACNCCVRMTCSLTRPGHPGSGCDR
ncbi:hypothetical protein EPAKOI_002087 [Cupriavidus sp. H18C2]